MTISAQIHGIDAIRNGIDQLERMRIMQIDIWLCTKFGLYSFERVQ
jgi:hypothetical protein